MFFGLNLFFNGVVIIPYHLSPSRSAAAIPNQNQMWTLFTQALAKGHSTTQVSIMNTSTNFMITAFLGFAIFAEALPPLWWVGATLLVAGNVIIGRKDESAEGERSEGEDAETGRVGVPPPRAQGWG
ncbi:hypothetical protein NUW58_g10929 [Xylaria curta]|uniref:Uncharacterized protein n=1 Tax=Xylaria curta TaxID=42375 RepID=A0ACC1MG28_9PEZI|nr:hypothetical protein NUW58_g10929 [Xylaria curta]